MRVLKPADESVAAIGAPYDPQPEYLIVIIAQTAHLCTATVWDRASDGRCDAGDQRNPQNRRSAAVTTPSAACFE